MRDCVSLLRRQFLISYYKCIGAKRLRVPDRFFLLLGTLAICICKRLRVLHNSNMADLTNLFKATVKGIKSRNKTLNKDVGTDIKTNIFPKKKIQGDFEMKSKELVMQTNQLFCSSQSRFRTQHFFGRTFGSVYKPMLQKNRPVFYSRCF